MRQRGENAGNKFKQQWDSSSKTNKEVTGQILFDFENAKVTFEIVKDDRATSTSGFVAGKAGDKFQGSDKIILANVHTHPTEHTFLGIMSNGRTVTDQINFNNQYSENNADGKRAKRQGANYTIGKFNVDYFSPRGKGDSKNNITTRYNLENNKGINLLKHAFQQYGKKK